MSDLGAAARRLNEAIDALEGALKAERAESAKLARKLEKEAQAAAAAREEAEALRRDLAAANESLSASGEIDPQMAARFAETEAARQRAESARIAAIDAADEAARERDEARAAAEDAARERDEALERVSELEAARSDDARLRAEAAEALDAAIGELKTLSGERADG